MFDPCLTPLAVRVVEHALEGRESGLKAWYIMRSAYVVERELTIDEMSQIEELLEEAETEALGPEAVNLATVE